MSTSPARRVAPARRTSPRHAPEPVRRLRLVEDAPQRRPLRRFLIVAGAIVVCASLLAIAASHAILVSNQVRLDHLQDEVAAEQARYSSLRLEVAELESPSRIVEAARRMGMVDPAEVLWLQAAAEAADPNDGNGGNGGNNGNGNGGNGGDNGDGGGDGGRNGSEGSWAATKPYLGGPG